MTSAFFFGRHCFDALYVYLWAGGIHGVVAHSKASAEYSGALRPWPRSADVEFPQQQVVGTSIDAS
jgi:hypothetical protein